jgi:glycosyltransferase involved in cell wall biosynthesis
MRHAAPPEANGAGAPGRDVLCLSSIDWTDNWQVHQQLAKALAARGDRVLFVENTGVRPPTWTDAARVRRRFANWARGPRAPGEGGDRLTVYAPLVLPLPYLGLATRVNRVLLEASVRRWRRGWTDRELIVWTFLPTPLALALIRALNPQLTVYHCVDDLASTSRAARRITASETTLLRRADLVLVTSEGLRARAARHRTQVALLPSAVDIEAFDRARDDHAAVPADLRRLPRPVVGYVGEVKRWLDQELLLRASACLQKASFVLVGPIRTDVARLAEAPNIHLLGPRAHDQIPKYLSGFDAALIPYRIAPYTDHVHPAKLYEYLAMGLPVISTSLREVVRLNRAHGEIVAVADDAAAFCAEIQRALDRPDPAAVARRVATARANSWTERFAVISELLAAKLGPAGPACDEPAP